MLVMILGRCSLLLRIRSASELSKQRYACSAGLHSVQENLSAIGGTQFGRIGRNSSAFQTFPARMASTTKGGREEQKQNRLAFEKSPYLLQHASNPVDWYPWGEEALEKAKAENKMIFLSVGYSTCHWCHVMEKESFTNKEIAEIMNKHFVNIKVDREERPDIDRIYIAFIQMETGHAGWPMSVFLSPDLKPIVGGTYFPPEDMYGRKGFKTILLEIAEKWQKVRSDMVLAGLMNFGTLQLFTQIVPSSETQEVPPAKYGNICIKQLAREFEPKFGGFTRRFDLHSPKFPEPMNFNFLFHMYARKPKEEVGQNCLYMCTYTLTKIALGGIHDHVGQGFSRYATDGEWHVPHFEKMLYDQGQLMQSYTDAYLATNQKLFSEMITDIATYVARDLRHKEGGFYSAEDADSYPTHNATVKTEGAFYVWTASEIETHLNTEIPGHTNLKLSDLFSYHFNVRKEGNVRKFQDHHGELVKKNVLMVYDGVERTSEHFGLSVEETTKLIQEACKILYKVRETRPRPHLDDKIVTAWNGLMISGLARGGAALKNEKYVEYAADAARFIERYLFDRSKRVLYRSCYRGEDDAITHTSVPVQGFLDDHAFLIKGLLDLYEANFDEHWLEFAEELQEIQDNRFWDEANGGYFATTEDDSSVILRLKEVREGSEPSGNSIAAGNLLRLAAYLDRDEFKDRATKLFSAFREQLMESPATLPQLVSALVLYHDGMTQIYITGQRDAKDTAELLSIVHSRLISGKVLILVDHKNPDNMLFRRNKILGEMKPQNGRATAYVCRHRVCSLPITSPEKLVEYLDESQ